mgnify:CR=1 FL=1|tara:strand:+ start:4573 stop:6201 length:1629 start_codon:yes stop_codon:yes gene_type:complete
MFKSLKRNFFPFIIAFSALSISASAAFYSVSGLSKLFAGAQLEVIIMAGSLEFGKLVIASLLYQYWDTINKWLRTYLTIAAVILVLITSMGIYGFLSAAYQETYQKLVVQQNQIEFLDNKAQFYEADVTRYDEELERISNNIATLSNARSQQIQVRDTTVAGGVRTTISTSELRLAQSRINVEEENRRSVQAKREVAADSLQTIKLKILDLQNESDTVGELGPLQYLSGLTGTPMDKIINILLLVIIFVFDPLAISMVVAANFAFDMANPKRKEDEETPYDPTLTDDFEDDDDYYDNRGSVYYDDEDEYAEDTILDKHAEKAKKPPLDIQAEPTKEAQAWYDIADKLKEAAVDMDEDQILEEEFEHLKDWVDIKEEQMKDTAFMDFQKKMDEYDAELEAAEEEIEAAEEELDEFEKEVEEWKNRKWEVENTAGDVAVIDPEEDNSDKTEMESDRTGTFPNENNPTSVGAVVQKIDTPHLPQEEKPAPNVIKPRALPPEARGVEPPVDKVKEVDEDELFDAAMRKKAEEDMKDFLNKRDDKQN